MQFKLINAVVVFWIRNKTTYGQKRKTFLVEVVKADRTAVTGDRYHWPISELRLTELKTSDTIRIVHCLLWASTIVYTYFTEFFLLFQTSVCKPPTVTCNLCLISSSSNKLLPINVYDPLSPGTDRASKSTLLNEFGPIEWDNWTEFYTYQMHLVFYF